MWTMWRCFACSGRSSSGTARWRAPTGGRCRPSSGDWGSSLIRKRPSGAQRPPSPKRRSLFCTPKGFYTGSSYFPISLITRGHTDAPQRHTTTMLGQPELSRLICAAEYRLSHFTGLKYSICTRDTVHLQITHRTIVILGTPAGHKLTVFATGRNRVSSRVGRWNQTAGANWLCDAERKIRYQIRAPPPFSGL